MKGWTLPREVDVNGKRYKVNADYRDVLDIIERINDVSEDEQIRAYVSLALFYENFESMPIEDYQEAINQLYWFISCGETGGSAKQAKVIDWEQDQQMIVADINKVAGCEVRNLPFCHWWTFIGWFNSIGEGQLSTVVSIREKKRKGKRLNDWEREFYRKNRSRVDFKTKYTTQEDSILKEWT